jgi:transposase
VYDLLAPLVERIVVANPIKVKQIAQARVKTDVRDTLILARLLAANLVPEVWVPPAHVRELRQLLSQRRQLVETHTQIVNRMHSVAHRHHLKHEPGKRFNEKNTAWQKDKRLSKVEQFQLELEMENRVYIEKQISRIGKEVAKMSHRNPWAQDMTYLMQLPGFGVITGMTVLAAIGEVQRFGSAKKLASYSGLTGGLEQSGTKLVQKGIMKEGRKELRWATLAPHCLRSMVQCRCGGSRTTGREVRSALESPFPGTPQAHAPQPGHRRHSSTVAGTGLVCLDPPPALPLLLP